MEFDPKTLWKDTPVKHLSQNDMKATNNKDISNLLAKNFSKNFSKNCSPNNYDAQFQDIKEKKKLNFHSNNKEDYSQIFSLFEIIVSLKTSHNTVVGPDEVH